MTGIFREALGNNVSVEAGEAWAEGQALKFVASDVLLMEVCDAVTDPVDAIALTKVEGQGFTASVQMGPGFCGVLLDDQAVTQGMELVHNADGKFVPLPNNKLSGAPVSVMAISDCPANELCPAVFLSSGQAPLRIGNRAFVNAGAAFGVGEPLKFTSGGPNRMIECAATTDPVDAIAVQAAAAAGDVVAVQFAPGYCPIQIGAAAVSAGDELNNATDADSFSEVAAGADVAAPVVAVAAGAANGVGYGFFFGSGRKTLA